MYPMKHRSSRPKFRKRQGINKLSASEQSIGYEPRYNVTQRVMMLFTLVYGLCFVCYLIAYDLIGDRFWPLALINTFAYVVFIPLFLLLPLTLLVGSRIGLLRLLPIVAIFIVWLLPSIKPHPTLVSPSTNSIRIVTFNTLWDN